MLPEMKTEVSCHGFHKDLQWERVKLKTLTNRMTSTVCWVSFVLRHICCTMLVNHVGMKCFANAYTITPILICIDFRTPHAGKNRNPAMGTVNEGADKHRLFTSCGCSSPSPLEREKNQSSSLCEENNRMQEEKNTRRGQTSCAVSTGPGFRNKILHIYSSSRDAFAPLNDRREI